MTDDERQELHELRALFELQQRRMREATARWRDEDPEARALVLPDLGDLLKWLMDDADKARAQIPQDGRVRVYAVANLHKGRIHGITCNVNQSAAWVRALCEQHGPGAAVQGVDLVDPAQQTIAWDRGERAE